MDLIEHRVRERAYHIWEGEGRVHGRADAHWLRAESEIAAPAPILTVQPVAEASLAPSPAKTLKPRSAGTKSAATKAAVEAKPAKAAAKIAAAKIDTAKATAAKPAAAKAPKALATKPKTARAPATAASLH